VKGEKPDDITRFDGNALVALYVTFLKTDLKISEKWKTNF
jgi:hypothetical protein